MKSESRTKKALLNAKVSTICYIVAIATTFFTRKVFLDSFGEAFIGLTSTLQSILGFLNLAELGVFTAIAYVLYKPIFEGNQGSIKEIIAVLQFLYRCIGLFILIGGLIISVFIPYIFRDVNIEIPVIYFGFYCYLAASLLGYFVNYKATLLSADQKNYLVTGYYQIVFSTKAVIQMILAIYLANFYVFLFIELLAGVVNSIILNVKIAKVYPWLKLKEYNGKKLLKNYPQIGKSIRQLFVHKIGSFVQNQVTPIFIYMYISLPMVALYTNYTLISTRISGLVNGIANGVNAGVGNLIAEGNTDKTLQLYNELLVSRICIAGVASTVLFYLFTPFIIVWLGKEYAIGQISVFLICTTFFMTIVRTTTDGFINGYGLFSDIWAPFAESGLFVLTAVALGPILGLNGILLAPIISLAVVVYIWKPYFLFNKGLKKPFVIYWRNFIAYMLPTVVVFILIKPLCNLIISDDYIVSGWSSLIISGFIYTSVIALLNVGTTMLFYPSMRRFVGRIVAVRRK